MEINERIQTTSGFHWPNQASAALATQRRRESQQETKLTNLAATKNNPAIFPEAAWWSMISIYGITDSLAGQLGFGQPEFIHVPYDTVEGVPSLRLSDVAVCMVSIAIQNVLFKIGSGQNYGWDGSQVLVFLDKREKLAAIHSWQVQIEQNELRPRSADVRPFFSQKGHCLHAVGG